MLTALDRYLLAPDVVADAVATYIKERQRLSKQRAKRHGEISRDLAAVKRRIEAMLELAMAGNGDAKSINRKLVELETDQNRLEIELTKAPGADAIAVHPGAPERYRAKVAQIHEALKQGQGAAHDAIKLLRDLVDHIIVSPTERPAPVGLQVVGNLAALLMEAPSGMGGAESMVAGVRFYPTRRATSRGRMAPFPWAVDDEHLLRIVVACADRRHWSRSCSSSTRSQSKVLGIK